MTAAFVWPLSFDETVYKTMMASELSRVFTLKECCDKSRCCLFSFACCDSVRGRRRRRLSQHCQRTQPNGIKRWQQLHSTPNDKKNLSAALTSRFYLTAVTSNYWVFLTCRHLFFFFILYRVWLTILS